MGNESICFSISNEVLQEQLVLKEGNEQIEELERILLEKIWTNCFVGEINLCEELNNVISSEEEWWIDVEGTWF